MDSLILLIIICSFWCFGFQYCTLYTPNMGFKNNDIMKQVELYPTDPKKELLWFIRYYGNLCLPVWLTKPLYGCLMCMSSVHGSIFYWGYILTHPGRINLLTFILWVVTVMAVAGLNRLLKQIAQL